MDAPGTEIGKEVQNGIVKEMWVDPGRNILTIR